MIDIVSNSSSTSSSDAYTRSTRGSECDSDEDISNFYDDDNDNDKDEDKEIVEGKKMLRTLQKRIINQNKSRRYTDVKTTNTNTYNDDGNDNYNDNGNKHNYNDFVSDKEATVASLKFQIEALKINHKLNTLSKSLSEMESKSKSSLTLTLTFRQIKETYTTLMNIIDFSSLPSHSNVYKERFHTMLRKHAVFGEYNTALKMLRRRVIGRCILAFVSDSNLHSTSFPIRSGESESESEGGFNGSDDELIDSLFLFMYPTLPVKVRSNDGIPSSSKLKLKPNLKPKQSVFMKLGLLDSMVILIPSFDDDDDDDNDKHKHKHKDRHDVCENGIVEVIGGILAVRVDYHFNVNGNGNGNGDVGNDENENENKNEKGDNNEKQKQKDKDKERDKNENEKDSILNSVRNPLALYTYVKTLLPLTNLLLLKIEAHAPTLTTVNMNVNVKPNSNSNLNLIGQLHQFLTRYLRVHVNSIIPDIIRVDSPRLVLGHFDAALDWDQFTHQHQHMRTGEGVVVGEHNFMLHQLFTNPHNGLCKLIINIERTEMEMRLNRASEDEDEDRLDDLDLIETYIANLSRYTNSILPNPNISTHYKTQVIHKIITYANEWLYSKVLDHMDFINTSHKKHEAKQRYISRKVPSVLKLELPPGLINLLDSYITILSLTLTLSRYHSNLVKRFYVSEEFDWRFDGVIDDVVLRGVGRVCYGGCLRVFEGFLEVIGKLGKSESKSWNGSGSGSGGWEDDDDLFADDDDDDEKEEESASENDYHNATNHLVSYFTALAKHLILITPATARRKYRACTMVIKRLKGKIVQAILTAYDDSKLRIGSDEGRDVLSGFGRIVDAFDFDFDFGSSSISSEDYYCDDDNEGRRTVSVSGQRDEIDSENSLLLNALIRISRMPGKRLEGLIDAVEGMKTYTNGESSESSLSRASSNKPFNGNSNGNNDDNDNDSDYDENSNDNHNHNNKNTKQLALEYDKNSIQIIRQIMVTKGVAEVEFMCEGGVGELGGLICR